jgi:hypothetical protein
MITMNDREDPYAAYAEREADHQELTGDDGPLYVEMNAEPPHPPRTLADYERMAGHEPTVDELLADPQVAAEADQILAGEGGTILGIPFAPSKPESERGE